MIVYMLLCRYDNGLDREIKLFTNRYKAQKYKQELEQDKNYVGITYEIILMEVIQ